MKRIRPTHQRQEKTFDYAPRAPRRPAVDAQSDNQTMMKRQHTIQRMRPLESARRALDVQTMLLFNDDRDLVLSLVTQTGTTNVLLSVDKAAIMGRRLIQAAKAMKARQD